MSDSEERERGFWSSGGGGGSANGGEHKKSKIDRLNEAFHLGKELLNKVTKPDHPNSLTPGKPPSKPTSPGQGLPNPYENDLVNAMNNLSVSPSPNPPGSGARPNQAPFIGGFGFAPSNAPYDYNAPPPVPPMPTPFGNGGGKQSLTMQYALSDSDLSPGAPPMTPPRPGALSSSISVGPTGGKISGGGGNPGYGRASSVPPPSIAPPMSPPTTPSRRRSSDGAVQCSGYTKSGPRCTRMVKPGPGYDPDLYPELFCHQHTKEVNKSTGFYATKDGIGKQWLEFKDYIPAYLQEETQAALRSEMSKPRSTADVPGYIYTFEIIDTKNTKQVALKVGRAVKLNKRIDEWSKQCASKPQHLVGFWPENTEDEDGNRGSTMKGMVKAGDPKGWCHKLERLIHLELGDLVINEAYLETSFPGCEAPEKKNKKEVKKECPDCGQMHKEIFMFTRPATGPTRDKEWEKIVWPVIKRWGDFVESYV